MGEVVFTQYIRPRGERKLVEIERPDEIVTLAKKIVALGYVFECEVLGDAQSTVSFTIGDPKREIDVAIQLVPNGPRVPETVDKLITNFAKARGLA